MARGFPFPIQPVFSEERGEGWVASRGIAPGEVVLRVEPLAAVPNHEALHSACARCFASSNQVHLAPCPHCKYVSFCLTCASSRSLQRHVTECEALALLKRESDEREDTTALRLILQLACTRRNALSSGQGPNQDEDEEGEEEEGEVVIVDSLMDDVDDLYGSEDDLSAEALATYVEVCKRIRLLMPARYRTSLHNLVQLAAKLHFNGMDITLDHTTTTATTSTMKAEEIVEWNILRQGRAIGEGLFPSAARFNHSCDPNCGLSFKRDGRLEVRAARKISRGAELLISYVGVEHLMINGSSKKERRKEGEMRRARLLKTYGFQCKCERCLADEEAV